jgi:hypothetical protein
MYWRYIPYFDLDEFSARPSTKESNGNNAFLALLTETVKYLAITAAIYLLLVISLSVL